MILTLAVALASVVPAFAQSPPASGDSWWREPVLLRLFDVSGDADTPAKRSTRPRLFRMSPRFLDDAATTDGSDPALPGRTDDLPVQFQLGEDNPHLDFRRAGDPGGFGYHRFSTEVVVAETGPTSFLLHLQAVTPAGLQENGVAQGATVVFPSLSCFHELGDGSSVCGFVGRSARGNLRRILDADENFQYGVSLQQPLPIAPVGAPQQVFLFVEATGRYRTGADASVQAPGSWELLPGVHWQPAERCWLSGGVLLPFGASRADVGLWQITCSWQF